MEIKKVCIYGVGGVGGYFAGKFTNALRQQTLQVFFVARGEHLRAIQSNGLIVKTPTQEVACHPTMAVESFCEIPTPDLVMLCVKSYDLENVVKSITENIGENTIILPLLNGIDIYQRIRQITKKGIVLPACVYVGTHIEKPGMIKQSGGNGKILIGEDPMIPDWNPEPLQKCFDDAGIIYQWYRDARPEIWEKYIFIAGYGLVGAAYGKTLGEIMGDPKLKGNTRNVMEEIYTIAIKQGIALRNSLVEESLLKGEHFPYDTKTSFHRDIERGGKNEGDLFGETILRLGKEHHVETSATKDCFQRIQKKFMD